jgi:DNA-binding MarR family transcriptional regulator
VSTGTSKRDELAAALNQAMRLVSGQGVLFSQAVASRLGVNSTDLECLGFIVSGQGVSAGDLARATGLTTGAITGVIDRLERAGLAKRAQDPADRRKVLVQATPAAMERVMPLFAPMEQAAMAVIDGYDDQALALILDFLQRAHQAGLEVTAALTETPGANVKNTR